MIKTLRSLGFILLISFLFAGCDKEESDPDTPSTSISTVTTNSVSSITTETAVCGGNVTANGGSAVTAKGVCWSVNPEPTIDLSTKTNDGTNVGSYVSNITGLTAGTMYYVRAYATNANGTAYGNEVVFMTETDAANTLAEVTTNSISSITTQTAVSGGNVISNGGSSVTAKGIIWDVNPSPTIGLTTQTNDGTNLGSYISSMTGLSPGVSYFVRAYATNSVGTAYGNEVVFTTDEGSAPTLFTNSASNISYETAQCGGSVLIDGGLPITQRGICWGTSPSPNINTGSVLNLGSGLGDFSGTMTDLQPGTTYYVRSWATNSAGTGYGNSISFNTTMLELGDLYEGGIIAYIYQPGDPGYSMNVQHGLICAGSGLSTPMVWGCSSAFIDNTSFEIGTGSTNTTNIISACGTNTAAFACADYSSNGFDDWFLPSRVEFQKICENSASSGVDQLDWTGEYWTSTEVSANAARLYDVESCALLLSSKGFLKKVWPVRYF